MKIHLRIIVFLILLHSEVHISLSCHRAEYLIGQECCPMCPHGTWVYKHCTEFRSTSCLPCEPGTYMDEPTGRTDCIRCRKCDPGSGLTVKARCSSTSNTVCEPEEGYFCVGPFEGGNCEASQRHTSCQPGHYIKQKGSASADTLCSPCPEDTFSNGTVFTCQSHTRCEENDKVTVKEGTSDSDTECGERSSYTIGIVLGVISAVILASVMIGVTFYFKKINKKKRRTTEEKEEEELQCPVNRV